MEVLLISFLSLIVFINIFFLYMNHKTLDSIYKIIELDTKRIAEVEKVEIVILDNQAKTSEILKHITERLDAKDYINLN